MTQAKKKITANQRTALFSLLSALLMFLLILIVYRFNVPNPNMILITALVLFTGLGGIIPGAVSAVLMLGYSMFFFSVDHSFFHYTDLNLQKMFVVILGVVMCYLLVAFLKHSRDKSDRELHEKNCILEEEARTATRLAELSRSVTSLLTNIPALTFSKDIETGKYLACNQLFAEYCHKSCPEDVVGLTDFDIFDRDTAAHFVEDDKRALSMDEPYIFFEDVPDAAGREKHFQTTKQKFSDASGRICTLGLCVDVTELVRMKKETLDAQEAYERASRSSNVYSSIAKALSSDYSYLYYVDLDTEEFIEYSSDSARGMLSVERKADDFFASSRRDAEAAIAPEDRDRFIRSFTRENIQKDLEEKGTFSLNYCLLIDEKPVHVNMRAKKLTDEENKIIIGVMNIEADYKQRQALEQLHQEQVNFARFAALNGDYLALFTVDPETDSYRVYRTSSDFAELGLARTGENFFVQAPKDAKSTVSPEDLERFTAQFTRENVMKAIREHGVFALKYRLLVDGKPKWVYLKAAEVEESDGKKLIVGLTDIDRQVRRETEYERTLVATRAIAHRDALTGVKNKLSYLEAEAEMDQQIISGHPLPFAIALFDVNDLKAMNDRFGHQSGDKFLRVACRIICNVFKHSPVYRIGGDEFVAIAQGQDEEKAEELLAQLDEINRANTGTDEPVIAYGMARFEGEASMAEVFRKADERMYKEKSRLKGSSSR